ncbi:hypothetical protein Dsin_012591 [Dipteronia sinensis]|uniref:Uncharacterized protein n=1 Tax=Dipteronia sinensis TaxID=43782 RepID=A0AAE0AIC1_9ROSI|nr:hypothetical protein Dsin_012591 [Dipteronia sinensis]
MTHNVVQTTTIHVPIIVSMMSIGEHSKYTSEHFRRRFRMDMELFKKILLAIGKYNDYFTQKVDAVGKDGLSPLQKMIADVQVLANGCPANILDEYAQIGENTAIESLERFCDAVIGVFEKQYLRKPSKDEIARLLPEGEDRGFPEIFAEHQEAARKDVERAFGVLQVVCGILSKFSTYVDCKRSWKDNEDMHHHA